MIITKICIVGLGYVGLPLAVLFAKRYPVIGYDINPERVRDIQDGYDKTKEVDSQELKSVNIEYTTDPSKISQGDVIIVTVPTPIDQHNIPDLRPILSATRTVGMYMKKGSIVVYESTVYPGLTEEECVPLLERESGMRWKEDFFVGYSPERVNPGDKQHTIDKIVKVVSGDTPETTKRLAKLYGSVITAGIHIAPDIKTAEAAKVIENTQRDINIALMNELSIIFNKMGIDTKAVLEAAGTKWNFLKFEPGLVGGHCIGVDPYYLTFKAQTLGYHPEVILAGRRINDNMGKYVAEMTVKKLIKAGKSVKGSRVLIMGLTFKENISDIRNTRVIDIYRELQEYGVEVYITDPFAYPEEVKKEYGIDLVEDLFTEKPYDCTIVAVKHRPFIEDLDFKVFKDLMNSNPVLIDVKGLYSKEKALEEGFIYWRL
ncbi:MAG: nucleotide sugar dehydrogenase [Hydrogenothermaceae bacterium]|nr:nucleotide sugar dehydrogenase [Hydrogenothermaceae bacterium]